MKNQEDPTYLDVLNLFYKNGFPSILGAKATSVAMGVLYKWNSLYRPAEFQMANSELCHLSGVEFNIERSRQRICELCKVGRVPLFTYVSNGTKRAGTYKINGNLAANFRQTNGNLPEYNQRSQSKDQRSETEKDPPAYPIDGYIPGGAPARTRGSLDGRSPEEIKDLRETYVYYGYTVQKFDAELAKYGFEHMNECVELRIDREEDGFVPDNPVAYMAGIVRSKWMEKGNG